jgi:hypothetical protein
VPATTAAMHVAAMRPDFLMYGLDTAGEALAPSFVFRHFAVKRAAGAFRY